MKRTIEFEEFGADFDDFVDQTHAGLETTINRAGAPPVRMVERLGTV